MAEAKKGNMHLLINHNFENDLKHILRQDILDFGYPSSEIDEENVIYQFLVLCKRLVKKRPRTIVYANSFARPADPAIEQGLSLFEEKAKRGVDLNPHLNKAMGTINYSDGMLFDWGIYHFHLGTAMDADGYHIGRTGDILYAMVTDDTIFFITITEHCHWADKDLLEIVARNWEFLLRPHELPYANLTARYDSEETKRLRQSKVNVAQQLSNGKVYMSIGGGILANGGNAEAQRQRMELERKVKMISKQVDEMTIHDIVRACSLYMPYDSLVMPKLAIIYHFVLERISEDRINIVNVTDNQHKVVNYGIKLPSLHKIIYG